MEYRKEHVVKVDTLQLILKSRVQLKSTNPEFFSILDTNFLNVGYPEQVSNERRSKNIGDGAETRELDILQRQWNKGAKD